MGCESCGSGGGTPKGCQSNGTCGTDGCNKLNTFDWLTTYDISDNDGFDLVEVSFKKGNHKYFYHKPQRVPAQTGDMVTVDAGTGYNVGRISLSGELVRLQMKKKKVSPDNKFYRVIRPATERDLESLKHARELEKRTMVRARAIARSLDLDMKISDVEYQADMKKAIFYFIANGRVDFRELIKQYAREFHIKVEMRQIGSRQESALVGGIGSCGRELCCSTWLTNFSSVTTSAARYQNLALNQSKLTGQCGRLKCCLNYELDMYIESLKKYPTKARYLKTKQGKADLIKTDIFKKVMYYGYKDKNGRYNVIMLDPITVQSIYEANKRKEYPDEFEEKKYFKETTVEEPEHQFEKDLTGVIELPDEKPRKRRSRGNRKGSKPKGRRSKSKRNRNSGPKNKGGNSRKK
ncbi:hypothetical protein KUV50_01670 [Membranicola marinus]|uniref:PSP1 C-terminal domain-containing protein n=1 Tax=Membranihabitans marinus TaxID=1227546 RepID=A0A953HR26_9BACT|nr:regulatory iron-sulfur-containing complex subunit RicT [Membranihabitans marinus]MBY5956825.1 hypothetical protein [Membranihabitans marinus]